MELSSLPEYEYSPLPGRDWIRLLKLLTGTADGSPVIASLEEHQLDDGIVEYTSLSYSWGRNKDGDASLNHTIGVDGRKLNVTENLHDCLLQLVREDAPPLLWVDAVCIHQADVGERNAQVAMMADIYKRASSLLIWLGQDHDGNEDALAMEALSAIQAADFEDEYSPNMSVFDDLHLAESTLSASALRLGAFKLGCKLGKKQVHRDENGKQVIKGWLKRPTKKLIRFGLGTSLDYRSLLYPRAERDPSRLLRLLKTPLYIGWALGSEYSDAIKAVFRNTFWSIAKLCQRRYFSRRWIIQEIFHSNQQAANVRWGPFRVSISDLVTMLMKCHLAVYKALERFLRPWITYKRYDDVDTLRKACIAVIAILNIRDDKDTLNTNDGSRKILSFVHKFQHTSCADERDIIYALVSLAEGETSIVPNYSLPTGMAYADFATKLAEGGALSTVLEWASRQSHSREQDFRNPKLDGRSVDFSRRAPQRAILSSSGGALTFRARIGSISLSQFNFHNEKLRHRRLRSIRIGEFAEGDYACDFFYDSGEYGVPRSGFVLRPVTGLPSCFTLVGEWHHNEPNVDVMLHFVTEARIETITLH
ncbi:hypothetical protein LTR37_017298 [Vermiconidia calcicola]|uniref:Uncharacterized protein n=1 Tax=Vermiconidia calcicola TaxID=1690605 RepID=A0ACC3MKH1_9PEZI|nr:hypothetical protein LTR37_017298 [Vermiconidia calcicola]